MTHPAVFGMIPVFCIPVWMTSMMKNDPETEHENMNILICFVTGHRRKLHYNTVLKNVERVLEVAGDL